MTTFNADEIARLIQAADLPAFVAMTGGGCATLYVGPPIQRDGEEGRYWLSLGPGTFGYGVEPSTFGEDLYLGPDDGGESPAIDVRATGARTDADVAALVIEQLRKR